MKGGNKLGAEIRIGRYVLRARSSQMRAYAEAFRKGLGKIEKHLAEQRASGWVHDGLAVLAAANRNFLAGPFPAELLQGFEPSERQRAFIEACRKAEVRDGLTQISSPRRRKITGELGLEVHFSPLRAFRPVGAARTVDLPIDKSFSAEEFSFKKAGEHEVFIRGVLGDRFNGLPFSVFYQLIPFAAGHAVFVPDVAAGLNQYIGDIRKLAMAWEFLAKLADPGVWLGYNSLGAYASVNQYHWQVVCETKGWRPPIVEHLENLSEGNARLQNWPLEHATVFRGERERILNEAFGFIDRINILAKESTNEYAYNLWMRAFQESRGGDIVVLPVRHQSTQVDLLNGKEGRYTTGMAFFEAGGNIIIPTEDDYNRATEENLLSLFAALSIPKGIF